MKGDIKMSQELQNLLNQIVITPNEIDGIMIFDPKQALSLYRNTQYDKERHGDELFENYDEIAGALSGVHHITDTLSEFGTSSQRGDLQYAVFQLSNGILVLYFLTINQEPVVVAFISGTPEGLGLLLKHSQKNISDIEKKLKELL